MSTNRNSFARSPRTERGLCDASWGNVEARIRGSYIDGKKVNLEEEAKKGKMLARYKKHSIDILIDTVEINDKNFSRIFESVERALKLSTRFS